MKKEMTASEKIAIRITMIEWKIENVENEIKHEKESLVSSVESLDRGLYNINFVQLHANNIAKAHEKLLQLREAKEMLEELEG